MRQWSLARRLFLLHVLSVVAVTVFVSLAMYADARDQTYAAAGARTLAVAEAIADSPLVLEAASTADPTSTLQPYAAQVIKDASLDFVTIMAPDGTRWTHANPAQIGGTYLGSTEQARAGHRLTETYKGTLGPSVRSITPVLDSNGAVRAMVAAGVTVGALDVVVASRLQIVVLIALAILLLGSLGAYFLGGYLSRVTRGYGPEQLGQLFAYYSSVLHSVREGVVLVDPQGRVVIRNDQASRLLGLPEDDGARPSLAELDLSESLHALLASGRKAHDEIHVTDSRVLVVNQEPALSQEGRRQRAIGAVATLRDRTEIEALGSELQTMRTLSDALRSQTHEHANRLHTIVSLMELGRTEEALSFATDDLRLSQSLADELVDSIDEPVLTALIMGKAAQANELGVRLEAEAAGSFAAAGLSPQELVTIVGNLLDNAIDAAVAATSPKWVRLLLEEERGGVIVEVSDSGPGVPSSEAERVLNYGYSTKPHDGNGRGLGLALVKRAVGALGGSLHVPHDGGTVFTVVIPPKEESP